MKNMLVKSLGLFGVMMAMSSANAATYNLNAAIAGYAGWNVNLISADGVNWSVTATSDGTAGIKSTASQISFFYGTGINGGGFPTGLIPLAGANNSAFGSTSVGGGANTGGSWKKQGNSAVLGQVIGEVTDLVPNGIVTGIDGGVAGTYTGNTYTGAFALSGVNANSAKYFRITLANDDGVTWATSTATVAPEMPGAALLLVALLPLGFAVRKHMGVA